MDLRSLTSCLANFSSYGGGVHDKNGLLNELGQNIALKGVQQFLGSIRSLLEKLGIPLPPIVDVTEAKDCPLALELEGLFNRHGSDKSISHKYHRIYAEVFYGLDRAKAHNVLEIGIGTQNAKLASHMCSLFSPGSSLRALKEFFPAATIFGADIDTDILFEEDRIKTAYVDQLDLASFSAMQSKFGNARYSLIIEDGLHSIVSSLNTLIFALTVVAEDGFIVLEDLCNCDSFWQMITALLVAQGYNAKLLNSDGLCLVVQTKLAAQ